LLFRVFFPEKNILCFLFALFWVVHPLFVEEMAVCSGLASPMHAFFVLFSLYSFYLAVKAKIKLSWYLSSLFSFLLALISKESAIVLAPLLLFFCIAGAKFGIFESKRIKRIFLLNIPIWFIAVSYAALRLTALNFSNTLNFYEQSNVFTENVIFRFYTFCTVLTYGLKLIFLPLGLHPERSWPVFLNFFTPQVWISFLILAGLVSSAVFFWRKKPVFSFGIFWLFTAYFPMSNIVAQINALFWEHWLYLPSIGILLSILSVVNLKQHLFRRIFYIICIGVVMFMGLYTLSRNFFARTPYTYYSEIIKHEPNSVATLNNLAMSLAERGENKKVITYYLKAIAISDTYPQLHHNLAKAYLAEGKTKMAEEEFLKAIKIDERFYYSRLSLGEIYLAQRKMKQARDQFKKALEVYPYLPSVRSLIGRLEAVLDKDSGNP